jgi:hypothetical protein
VKYIIHLVKRFMLSLSRGDVSKTELAMVRETLSAAEYELWCQFNNADRRHSVLVAARFVSLLPEASHNDLAGVLLHDIGKTRSNLSTLQRVVATIVGPRTRRFALYHEHEQIGVELLQQAGSHGGVIAILNRTCNADVAAAFRAADNI